MEKSILKKIKDLNSLDYTKMEVLKLTKHLPSIYSHSIESINKKIEDMITFGGY